MKGHSLSLLLSSVGQVRAEAVAGQSMDSHAYVPVLTPRLLGFPVLGGRAHALSVDSPRLVSQPYLTM